DERLLELGERIGEKLRQRGETVAVAESSSGGLVSAALLAVAGASAYFRGGGAVYTGDAKARFLGLSSDAVSQPRAATEGPALGAGGRGRRGAGGGGGVGRARRGGPDGQSLRRRARPHLRRRRRSGQSGQHARDRIERPPREHGRLRARGAPSAR